MTGADLAPVMELMAVANGGTSTDVVASDKKDNTKMEEAGKSKDVAVANTNANQQNKASENDTEGSSHDDAKMEEAQDAKEDDVGAVKQAGLEDVISGAADNTDAKEGNGANAAEHEDSKTAAIEDVVAKEDDNTKSAEHKDFKMVIVEDTDAKEDDKAKAAEHEDSKTAGIEDVAAKEDANTKSAEHKDSKMVILEDADAMEDEKAKAAEHDDHRTGGVAAEHKDHRTGGVEDADANEYNGARAEECKDAKMNSVDNADMKEDEDANAAEHEDAKMVDVDAADSKEDNGTKVVEHEDVKMGTVEDIDAKEDNNAKAAEHEDIIMGVVEHADVKEDNSSNIAGREHVKMTEAETKPGDAVLEDKGHTEEKDVNTEVKKGLKDAEQCGSEMQDELNGKGNNGAARQQENKAEEMSDDDSQGEEEVEEKGSSVKKEEGEDGKANENEEKLEKESAKKEGKDGKVTEEEVGEADKNVEENKEETPKNKRARSARDRRQGQDKKQHGSKSREAKSLLNTPSPYGIDRPQRERKIVERLVEVIDKEPNRNFVVEKGRGTPLKDIPSVAQRLTRKKPADLKFLHNVLFGRKGKTVDFKGHILQFSGFVWHESDEKQRAKAKEKLDKCMKDMLVDLCWLLAIPVPKTNIRKEDIVAKLLDFIAEPHVMPDSGLSDDQGSNYRKRKRGGGSSSKTSDITPKRSKKKFADHISPRQKQALEYDTDEDVKSGSEEDADESPDEQEDGYDSAEEKASRKSSEVKDSAGKKKAAAGSTHRTSPPRTASKTAGKTSPSKGSKEKESLDESAKVFSRKKKPIISKRTPSSEKVIEENKSSGKEAMKSKGESAEGGLPSKAELKKTIIGILKKVDFNTSTFSDILKKLDDHYKIDLTSKKGAIKIMIQEELTKLSEQEDDDQDKSVDAKKKQSRHRAKVTG
ncbi:eukaryotic translation initiation factor 5B-like [Hordeum vulgare subsp. vulgare]|uniref:DEK-C domain-containing protein n=1 Tax=Hordeum vulgare subsp. vulgare TaxID=112509 RepID=A0A8I6XZV4_HORVV|nr:eukaryotic translation initiation factor 5B-like [Hordeum vulgare subsp. vulgare]